VSADVAPLPMALIILAVCVLGSPGVRERMGRWRRNRGRRAAEAHA